MCAMISAPSGLIFSCDVTMLDWISRWLSVVLSVVCLYPLLSFHPLYLSCLMQILFNLWLLYFVSHFLECHTKLLAKFPLQNLKFVACACERETLGWKKKGVPSAESSRSVQGLGKGVSGKPYPRLCNARRPRLEPGTFRSQAVRLYRLH